jgi:ubiquinol oxidase
MVGATLNHLRRVRRMCDDRGWIKTLMDEAENERMHLMTFVEVAKPTLFERFVILAAQWAFYLFFFALYLISSKTAHRLVGYFEEEAIISCTVNHGYANDIAGLPAFAVAPCPPHRNPAGNRQPDAVAVTCTTLQNGPGPGPQTRRSTRFR